MPDERFLSSIDKKKVKKKTSFDRKVKPILFFFRRRSTSLFATQKKDALWGDFDAKTRTHRARDADADADADANGWKFFPASLFKRKTRRRRRRTTTTTRARDDEP